MLFKLAGPVLSLTSTTTTTANLAWTDISIPGAGVVGYRLYRGTGSTPSSFTLLATLGVQLTYGDSGLAQGGTYTYFVVGIYDSGVPTGQSNYLTISTSPIYYAYSTHVNRVDVYDVHNPASMSLPQSNVSSISGASNQSGACLSMSDYMWLWSANTVWLYNWAANNLNPTQVQNNVFTYLNTKGLIIRRGVATRNNFAFIVDTGAGAWKCFDITTPGTPTEVGSFNLPYAGSVGHHTLAFDAVNNRLIGYAADLSSHGVLQYMAVASNGALSNLTTLSVDGSGLDGWAGGFIWGGYYWVLARTGYLQNYTLAGAAGGTAWQVSNTGTNKYVQTPARLLQNRYAFFTSATSDANPSIVYVDMNNGTVYSLGGTNVAVTNLLLSNNILFYTVGTTIFAYDMTNATSPQLLGSANTGQLFGGLTGYISSGWDGNNGLCLT
jgi:hypothetical protein